MAAGIYIHDFWDLTYQEMTDVVDAYNKRRETELKERASMDYTHAELIMVGTARVLGGEIDFPTIYEAYSHLFESELEVLQKQKEQKEIEAYKARWLAFADSVNSQRGKK